MAVGGSVRRRVRLRHAAALTAGLMGVALGTTATARPETRTLRIYHINLHESSEITFKRDGKYLPDGLKKANWALRDWRRNQPTTMDPRLLDLLWEAYQKSGSHMPIHVIGGFRAPETNKMLRSRSAHTGVAEHSQHMLGKAVDFFIPDVPLAKLREIGLKMQIGGVGFYPRSGAPFVHFDVGSGRYWPRMSRQELTRIFPDGKTIHLPADGKPLPGYAAAMASYKQRKGASELMVADAGSTAPRRSFLAALFGGGRDEAEDEAEASDAPLLAKKAAPPAPAPEPVPAAAAPPKAKPPELPPGVAMADAGAFDASAPTKSAEVVVAALATPERVPLPTHAPARAPEPEAPNPIDAVLVAALAEEADGASALPHGIPMPHERPALPGAASEIAQEIAAATPAAPAAAPALLAAAYAPETSASLARAPMPHARPPILEASLDRRAAVPVTPPPASSLAAKVRGGRVAGAARPEKRAHQSRPSGSQTAIAALLADPERRALEQAPSLPSADKLVAERPHDVLALGFAPTGAKPGSAAHFSGRAVNFLPVRHID